MSARFTDPRLQPEFDANGYVIVDLLDASEIACLQSWYDRYADRHFRGFSASIMSPDVEYRRAVDAAIKAVIRDKALSLLEGYRLVHASFAVKTAQSNNSAMELHQDITFVDESRFTSLTLWCPLVDVGPENGWLGVVNGSHRFNANLRDPSLRLYPDLVPMLESRYLTYLPMRAGQAMLMHHRTFHGSSANHADQVRVVAAGVLTPVEAPLLHCYHDWQNAPGMLEVFEVDEEFFSQHRMGARPQNAHLLGTVPRVVQPLTEADFRVLPAA